MRKSYEDLQFYTRIFVVAIKRDTTQDRARVVSTGCIDTYLWLMKILKLCKSRVMEQT